MSLSEMLDVLSEGLVCVPDIPFDEMVRLNFVVIAADLRESLGQ